MSFGQRHEERGFSLAETLVATGILVTILASLAQLVVWSVNQAIEAGRRSRAISLAQDKLEMLRALAWTVDLNGSPVSDPALAPSPSNALDLDTTGYVDRIDDDVRRWSVEPIDTGIPDAIAITVCVFREPATNTGRTGADFCLTTARMRQP